MTRAPKWVPFVVLVTATAGSMAPWAEFRWLSAAVTACMIGAAAVLIWTRTDRTPRFWTVATAICVAAGLAALVARQVAVQQCTAVNASEQRVVIGTAVTERGAEYKAMNPERDNNYLLETLGELPPTQIWTADSIRRCRLTLAAAGALWMPLLGVAALCAARALESTGRSAAAAPKQQVFLSYTHSDAEAAQTLCQRLRELGLPVATDSETMKPGESISGYIERSIRESDVVLSLVSSQSIMSSWVAMETLTALSRNRWVEGRLFIACYLDDQFMRPGFRLECTRKIDERLREIEQLIPEYAERRIDTVELNQEKTRLYDLRNHLGAILETLKGSLCLDVRQGKLENSAARIVAAVRELRHERA